MRRLPAFRGVIWGVDSFVLQLTTRDGNRGAAETQNRLDGHVKGLGSP